MTEIFVVGMSGVAPALLQIGSDVVVCDKLPFETVYTSSSNIRENRNRCRTRDATLDKNEIATTDKPQKNRLSLFINS